jgi:hypothetical protein
MIHASAKLIGHACRTESHQSTFILRRTWRIPRRRKSSTGREDHWQNRTVHGRMWCKGEWREDTPADNCLTSCLPKGNRLRCIDEYLRELMTLMTESSSIYLQCWCQQSALCHCGNHRHLRNKCNNKPSHDGAQMGSFCAASSKQIPRVCAMVAWR